MKKILIVFLSTVLFWSCNEDQINTASNSEIALSDAVPEEDPALKNLPIANFGPNNRLDLSNVKMIEGVGIGDLITLGMTRDQIKQLVTNGNCNSGSECSFKLSQETAAITVGFDNADKVKTIEVNQIAVFPQYRWSTTKGAIDGMSPEQVSALYPGSKIVSDNPYMRVIAESFGYQYNYFLSCSDVGCGKRATHLIFNPNEQPTAQRAFSGYIVLRNSNKKAVTANVSLSIKDPARQTTTQTFTQTIPGRGSVTLYPGDFVDINGVLGQYSYSATLKNNRGKVIGKASGSFSLFER